MNFLSKSSWSEYIKCIQIATRPEIIFPPVSKPYLVINKVSDRMTGVPMQIVSAPEHVEIEEAVERIKGKPGERNADEVNDDRGGC